MRKTLQELERDYEGFEKIERLLPLVKASLQRQIAKLQGGNGSDLAKGNLGQQMIDANGMVNTSRVGAPKLMDIGGSTSRDPNSRTGGL